MIIIILVKTKNKKQGTNKGISETNRSENFLRSYFSTPEIVNTILPRTPVEKDLLGNIGA